MARRFDDFDKASWWFAYNTQRLNVRELATIYGCSETTIRNGLPMGCIVFRLMQEAARVRRAA